MTTGSRGLRLQNTYSKFVIRYDRLATFIVFTSIVLLLQQIKTPIVIIHPSFWGWERLGASSSCFGLALIVLFIKL